MLEKKDVKIFREVKKGEKDKQKWSLFSWFGCGSSLYS